MLMAMIIIYDSINLLTEKEPTQSTVFCKVKRGNLKKVIIVFNNHKWPTALHLLRTMTCPNFSALWKIAPSWIRTQVIVAQSQSRANLCATEPGKAV